MSLFIAMQIELVKLYSSGFYGESDGIISRRDCCKGVDYLVFDPIFQEHALQKLCHNNKLSFFQWQTF